MYWLIFQIVIAILVIKIVDVLLISPLRIRKFYKKQGVNVDNWHPFHVIRTIKMLKKGNHVMHHYKHLVSTDKSAKGFLVY